MVTVACPKCGFEEDENARECGRCGIVFGKYGRPTPGPSVYPLPRGGGSHDADGRFGKAEIRVLAIGLVMAIVVSVSVNFIFHPIIILVHELGHAVVGWLLGYPSVPSFDFVYGGGITPHGPFQIVIVLVVAGGFIYGLYRFRENRQSVALIAGLFLVWLFIETSAWRREMAITAAGHASEAIFAGIFLYMAIAGVGWRIPELERPLGAFLAFFIQINMIRFCLDLMHDPDFLEVYRQGKGGMLMHDIDSVSSDLIIHTGWHPSVPALARLLLVLSFVPMALAVIAYLQRGRLQRVLRTLVTA